MEDEFTAIEIQEHNNIINKNETEQIINYIKKIWKDRINNCTSIDQVNLVLHDFYNECIGLHTNDDISDRNLRRLKKYVTNLIEHKVKKIDYILYYVIYHI